MDRPQNSKKSGLQQISFSSFRSRAVKDADAKNLGYFMDIEKWTEFHKNMEKEREAELLNKGSKSKNE